MRCEFRLLQILEARAERGAIKRHKNVEQRNLGQPQRFLGWFRCRAPDTSRHFQFATTNYFEVSKLKITCPRTASKFKLLQRDARRWFIPHGTFLSHYMEATCDAQVILLKISMCSCMHAAVVCFFVGTRMIQSSTETTVISLLYLTTTGFPFLGGRPVKSRSCCFARSSLQSWAPGIRSHLRVNLFGLPVGAPQSGQVAVSADIA